MSAGTVLKTNVDKQNPSLHKYFRYMVDNRKLTITFTPKKVIDIFENDLQIDLSLYDSVFKDVAIEMFTFYIQVWPGWQPKNFADCIDHPEDSYCNFKQYLKTKILGLLDKQKELENSESTSSSPNEKDSNLNPHVLRLPIDVEKCLPSGMEDRKSKCPYVLEIALQPKQFNSLKFSEFNNELVVSVVDKPSQPRKICDIEALNHPCCSVLFKIPGLIKLTRKNKSRIEMFLCKSDDKWKFPIQDKVIDIRKFKARDGIYTSDFLKYLFENIVTLFDKHKIENVEKSEVFYILNEFLKDVVEADLNNSTIQECTEINLSIGGSSYLSDSNYGGKTILRTIYQPQSVYSLIFCGIDQTMVNDDGITYFQKLNEENSENLPTVLNQLGQSINLTCQVCNLYFSRLPKFKQHILENHNNIETLKCTRCDMECQLNELMANRWYHDCKKKRKTNGNESTVTKK